MWKTVISHCFVVFCCCIFEGSLHDSSPTGGPPLSSLLLEQKGVPIAKTHHWIQAIKYNYFPVLSHVSQWNCSNTSQLIHLRPGVRYIWLNTLGDVVCKHAMKTFYMPFKEVLWCTWTLINFKSHLQNWKLLWLPNIAHDYTIFLMILLD